MTHSLDGSMDPSASRSNTRNSKFSAASSRPATRFARRPSSPALAASARSSDSLSFLSFFVVDVAPRIASSNSSMLCSTNRSALRSSTRAPARPFRALEPWRMKDQNVAPDKPPRAAATDQNKTGDASSNPLGTFMPARDAGTAATVSASVATVACRFKRTVRFRTPSRYSSHTSRVASTCRDISLS
jgi:hypothetical protein